MLIKPLLYAICAAVVLYVTGFDKRPIKAHAANITAVFSIIIFSAVYLVICYYFGAGANVLTRNFNTVVTNIWEIGSVVFFGEIIRFKLIRHYKNEFVTVFITVILAVGLMQFPDISAEMLFTVVFRCFVYSAVMSYIAFYGSFSPFIFLSFFYAMPEYLIPFVPNIPALGWSLLVSGTLFLTAIIFYALTAEKKETRYKERNPVTLAVVIISTAAVVMFFSGVFRYYPVVILSDSMTGTFSRGSIVIVEKIPKQEIFRTIEENEIIHFTGQTGVKYVHRITQFSTDREGRRVYITKGDAEEKTDTFPVPQDNILGITRYSIPVVGYPYLLLRGII